jgi:hypothetical protein
LTSETTAAEATIVADQTPKGIPVSQYELVNAGDYGAVYAPSTPGANKLVSPEQYGAYFAYLSPYEIKNCSFFSAQVQDENVN